MGRYSAVASVPKTLTYRLVHTSYPRIRVPGGRMLLLEATPRAGACGSYFQPVLEVLCGNASGVGFRLDGTSRPPLGASGHANSFVVRRA